MRVVFVAQLPPPVHGQAVVNQRIADASFTSVQVTTVPMAFSRSIDEVSKATVRKIGVLLSLIVRVVRARCTTDATTLWYSVGARDRSALLRDAVLLTAVRPWFARTIFHLHVGDLDALVAQLPAALRPLVKQAYRRPDGIIILDESLQSGSKTLEPRRIDVLANCVDDPGEVSRPAPKDVPKVSYIGTLAESKGIWVMLEAFRQLHADQVEFCACIVGESTDADLLARCKHFIDQHGLVGIVDLPGPVHGQAKDELLRSTDIFCFPSHYEGEAQPLAVIEAMSYGVPVVSTRWRAIPGLVEDGVTGVLVDAHDPTGLGGALKHLLEDPARRESMSVAGRARYVERFRPDSYLDRLEALLRDRRPVAGDRRPVTGNR